MLQEQAEQLPHRIYRQCYKKRLSNHPTLSINNATRTGWATTPQGLNIWRKRKLCFYSVVVTIFIRPWKIVRLWAELDFEVDFVINGGQGGHCVSVVHIYFLFHIHCAQISYKRHFLRIRKYDTCRAAPGLDIGLVGPVARGASRFENLLAPQKTYWPPKKLTGQKPNLRDEKLFA